MELRAGHAPSRGSRRHAQQISGPQLSVQAGACVDCWPRTSTQVRMSSKVLIEDSLKQSVHNVLWVSLRRNWLEVCVSLLR